MLVHSPQNQGLVVEVGLKVVEKAFDAVKPTAGFGLVLFSGGRLAELIQQVFLLFGQPDRCLDDNFAK